MEKILGIVHTETIQVSAEAYDIALDISPGKISVELHELYMNITGFISKFYPVHSYSVADGLLDFGTMRVFEENKLSLKMKNQGKYEIAYK